MPILNETTKSCAVQTFYANELDLLSCIPQVDCEVRDYIDKMQRDFWFIQDIQRTFTKIGAFETYMVHVVMSRLTYDT